MRLATFIVAALLWATGCFAQPYRVSEAQVVIGSWSFAPVVSTDNNGQAHVHSFLALKDKGTATGYNLLAVWYIRPADPNGQWSAKTWESFDQWEAIKSVKIELGIGDQFDNLWPTGDVKTEYPPNDPGVIYSQGFKTNDPAIAMLEGDPNRSYWIDTLTEIGYKAADVLFDKDSNGTCDQRGWLNTMSVSVEMNENAVDALSAPGNDHLIAFAAACAAAAGAPDCKAKIISEGAWSNYTCGNAGGWTTAGPVAGKCTYTRTRECEKSRKVTYQYVTCATASVTQKMFQTCTETQQCDANPNGTCPPADTCIGRNTPWDSTRESCAERGPFPNL